MASQDLGKNLGLVSNSGMSEKKNDNPNSTAVSNPTPVSNPTAATSQNIPDSGAVQLKFTPFSFSNLAFQAFRRTPVAQTLPQNPEIPAQNPGVHAQNPGVPESQPEPTAQAQSAAQSGQSQSDQIQLRQSENKRMLDTPKIKIKKMIQAAEQGGTFLTKYLSENSVNLDSILRLRWI